MVHIDGEDTSKPVKSRDEKIKFWAALESTVHDEGSSFDTNRVNSNLVKFLKMATDNYNEFIVTEQDLFRMCLTIAESELFTKNTKFCISKLLSLLNIDLLEMNMKFIIVYILLYECKRNVNSLVTMLEFQGFNVFYNTLYTAFAYIQKYGTDRGIAEHEITNSQLEEWSDVDHIILDEMKKISTVLMEILFIIFKYGKCSVANVQLVDDFFTYFLINSIRSDVTDDLFNNAQFKLALALNEQYIVFSKKFEMENKIFKYLLNSSVSKRFVELLLLKFNRLMDSSLQVMMCKVIYLIVTSTDNDVAMNYFYLNDLNVLIDVLIRELQNMNGREEYWRATILRVLLPLLKNTELCRTHYRKDDLVELLTYLSKPENICDNGVITQEQEVTIRLAKKCLNGVEWLENDTSDDDAISSNSLESSQSSVESLSNSLANHSTNNRSRLTRGSLELSAESLTMRKERAKGPPPPPPPPRSRKKC